MSYTPYRALLRSLRCSYASEHSMVGLPRSPRRFTHSASTKQSETNETSNSTHFGFETVSDTEKTTKVHQVFEQVAATYDKMNDAMSFGIHRVWKDEFVRNLSPYPDTKILDVAGGTGDIAFRLVRAMDQKTDKKTTLNRFASTFSKNSEILTDPSDVTADVISVESSKLYGSKPKKFKKLEKSKKELRDVTVFDLSESMLEVGKQRALQAGLDSKIDWVQGNAEKLPFSDETFDAYTIAFGIRNVTHIERALDEAFRVLKRGGRFMCLEFSQVRNPLFAWLYEKYSFQVIPVMGQVVASDWKSYQYLVESIRMFPDQEEFRLMIENASFSAVNYKNLSNGICAIHSAFKL